VFAFMAMQSRQFDPLRLVLQAMSLSASTFFAALVLSIWWRRFTSLGAIAAMAAGFVMAGFYQLNGLSFLGVDALTAAAIGVPVSFGAGIAASVVSGAPSAQALETADDLRIPAGETLHSRMLRLSARNKTNRASG
jgi:cation/acetate symporter